MYSFFFSFPRLLVFCDQKAVHSLKTTVSLASRRMTQVLTLRCSALSSPGTAQPGPCLCLGHKSLLLLRQRVIFLSWEEKSQCEIQPVLLCGGGLGTSFVVEGRRSSCINFPCSAFVMITGSWYRGVTRASSGTQSCSAAGALFVCSSQLC